MPISRRRFVQHQPWRPRPPTPSRRPRSAAGRVARQRPVPDSIRALKPLPGKAAPITDQERLGRIEKARRLMAEHDIGAIVLETGTSMTYFANVRWGLSERPFLLVIPQKGELAYVCPGFEEARARELTTFTKDVRVWQEDEDWGATVLGILKDRGVSTAQDRRRRARPLLHRRRHRAGGTGIEGRPGHAGDRRLPDDQVADRDRADAARQRHHHRSLPGRAGDAARRHDAGRARRATSARRSTRSAVRADRR